MFVAKGFIYVSHNHIVNQACNRMHFDCTFWQKANYSAIISVGEMYSVNSRRDNVQWLISATLVMFKYAVSYIDNKVNAHLPKCHSENCIVETTSQADGPGRYVQY